MRKVAASKVFFSPTDYLTNQIVEIDNSMVLAVRDLKCEEAMTEWLTGIIVLSNNDKINLDNINSISAFYCEDRLEDNNTIHAWHIANFNSATGCILDKNITLIK